MYISPVWKSIFNGCLIFYDHIITRCCVSPCTDPPPEVTIQTSGNSTVGETYTLNCTAVIATGLPGNPTVSLDWLGPSGAAVDSGDGINVGTQGTTNTRTLTFNSVRLTHAGTYTCRATLSTPDAPTGNRTSNVSVTGKNILLTQNTQANTLWWLGMWLRNLTTICASIRSVKPTVLCGTQDLCWS